MSHMSSSHRSWWQCAMRPTLHTKKPSWETGDWLGASCQMIAMCCMLFRDMAACGNDSAKGQASNANQQCQAQTGLQALKQGSMCTWSCVEEWSYNARLVSWPHLLFGLLCWVAWTHPACTYSCRYSCDSRQGPGQAAAVVIGEMSNQVFGHQKVCAFTKVCTEQLHSRHLGANEAVPRVSWFHGSTDFCTHVRCNACCDRLHAIPGVNIIDKLL